MKKVLLTVLVAGILATTANAATLRMNWAGSVDPLIELAVSDEAVIEVWMDLLASESLSTLIFANGVVADAPAAISQIGTTVTDVGAWTDGSINGVFGAGQQVVWGADSPVPTNSLHGPGAFLIGTQLIHLDAGDPSNMIEITFPLPGDPAFIIKDEDASDINKWDARYNTGYCGYIAFGDWGNPGWGSKTAKGHQPTPNPLLIHVIPEPGTLALLALGGLGILRRR